MLFYCQYEKKLRVAAALRKMGATPTEFGFDSHGLQTWRVNDSQRPSESECDQPSQHTWRVHAN
jgi:hypothetical protein